MENSFEIFLGGGLATDLIIGRCVVIGGIYNQSWKTESWLYS